MTQRAGFGAEGDARRRRRGRPGAFPASPEALLMTSAPRHRSFGQIFLIPAILALLVAVGLVLALLGDGIWDALSWFCLLVPVVAAIYFIACAGRHPVAGPSDTNPRYYGANDTRHLTGSPPPLQPKERHGFSETEASITNKLKRRTFSATFFLACLAAIELEGVALEEI